MMSLNRRQVLKFMAGGMAAGLFSASGLIQAGPKPAIKAIAFDGFPIFDPRPIFGLAKNLYPDKGGPLAKLWFTKIFGYTWLRTAGDQYKSFYAVIEDALVFSAESLQLDLPRDKKEQLMDIWLNLNAWPDVRPALESLGKNNIRLAFLSNLTEEMLRTNAKNAGIEDMFEFYLSTDRVQAYKPSSLAYRMGVEAFGIAKENIAFAAFAGWDATGAKWFGYPTVWVNRLGGPTERLGVEPDGIGKGMDGLTEFVLA